MRQLAEPSILRSGGVVAQVWRDGRRQVNLARVLPRVDVAALGEVAVEKVGELALLVQEDGHVLTSDNADIEALLRTRRVNAVVVRV